MSIDPIGCEDVDDAISVRRLDNGNLEVGVHIADVTHFVSPGSLTDLEARRRATTVYLADRRYDMLPPVLSAQLCSLLGGVERYAVSCIWELHPRTFAVKEVWYGRTVIKSSYKLCYEHAQDIINGKTALEMKEVVSELAGMQGEELSRKFGEVAEALELLSGVARAWQGARQREGALNLESTEVQFEFEERKVDSIRPKAHLEIHETVAECMIMANHWVARKIADTFPGQAILRLHPPPKKENFEQLLACAGSKGWTVQTDSNKALAESLNRCSDTADPTVNLLLRSLATLAMVQAVYFSTGSVAREDWRHYGLALDRYTHFTSPIRR
jgi:DIS3-like exonuclease 1